MLILDFMKFRNRSFLISWLGFLQGFVVLPWLHFQALHHKTHKEGLEVFLLLFTLMGKKDCFRIAWCIEIRFTHVQNAISLVFSRGC